MTDEIFEKLIPFEEDLRYITKLKFMSLSQQKFNILMGIYKELFNETLNQRQMSCPTCRMRAVNRIGIAYEEEKQIRAEKSKEERLNNDEQPPKKKVGRPKKIDLDKE